MKAPHERTPFGAWLVEQRARLGQVRGKKVRQIDVVTELAERGFPIDHSYYRGIEGGSKKAGRELKEALGAYFGATPPTDGQAPAELGELVQMLRTQTAAISELVEMLRQQAVQTPAAEEARVRATVEGLLRAGMRVDEPPPPLADMQP